MSTPFTVLRTQSKGRPEHQHLESWGDEYTRPSSRHPLWWFLEGSSFLKVTSSLHAHSPGGEAIKVSDLLSFLPIRLSLIRLPQSLAGPPGSRKWWSTQRHGMQQRRQPLPEWLCCGTSWGSPLRTAVPGRTRTQFSQFKAPHPALPPNHHPSLHPP